MKTFIVMELFLLISSIGISAQTADNNTAQAEYMNQHNRLAVYKKALKLEMKHPDLSRILIGNHLKSAWTGNSKPDSIITWDSTESQWFVYYMLAYTYDTNGKNTLDIAYSRDTSTNQIDTLWKEEYSYDAKGNNTSYVYYAKANYNHPLIVWKKDEYTYDDKGNVTLEIDYSWNTSQWIVADKKTFYYSGQIPTLTNHISENIIRVYPNPTKDIIVFDLSNISGSATVELYDMEGKNIKEKKLHENSQISVGNLPKGLYL
jgi:hypothetical protein